MPVIFSKSCEYALQAVLYIAKQAKNKPIPLQEISSSLQIPQHFLSKILQTLSHHEIIVSRKGHSGGFELARPAVHITLNDIVLAIDGNVFLTHCVLGFPGCSDELPCPVHDDWKDAKKVIDTMLIEKTINDLSKKIGSKLTLIELLSHRRVLSLEKKSLPTSTVAP